MESLQAGLFTTTVVALVLWLLWRPGGLFYRREVSMAKTSNSSRPQRSALFLIVMFVVIAAVGFGVIALVAR
jgi:hypothetical protein